MLSDKFAREFVIAPAGNHKFHLVVGYECAQILYAESVTLAGVGTLHIHDFHYLRRHAFQRPLTARLQQNGVACNQQPVHQRNRFALLQHRLASSDLDQATIGREAMHLVLDFLERHALAAFESVLAVAPGAAQVASRQPHKNARQPSVGGLSLQRLVNLDDLHGRRPIRCSAPWSCRSPRWLRPSRAPGHWCSVSAVSWSRRRNTWPGSPPTDSPS